MAITRQSSFDGCFFYRSDVCIFLIGIMQKDVVTVVFFFLKVYNRQSGGQRDLSSQL